MLELSWSGQKQIKLDDGITRTFLEDGDEMKLTGYALHPSGYRVGFGEVSGKIYPAKSLKF